MMPRQFETIEDAFTACRYADRPLSVIVNGERMTVFPSGTVRIWESSREARERERTKKGGKPS